MDEAKCRQRYAVFKEHYGTLLRLKQYFPFSLIDGTAARPASFASGCGAIWHSLPLSQSPVAVTDARIQLELQRLGYRVPLAQQMPSVHQVRV